MQYILLKEFSVLLFLFLLRPNIQVSSDEYECHSLLGDYDLINDVDDTVGSSDISCHNAGIVG